MDNATTPPASSTLFLFTPSSLIERYNFYFQILIKRKIPGQKKYFPSFQKNFPWFSRFPRSHSEIPGFSRSARNPVGKHDIFSWFFLANIYLFKFNDRNIRKRCNIWSKLTLKTPDRCLWRRSRVFIVNCEHISHIFLVFLMLTWNK